MEAISKEFREFIAEQEPELSQGLADVLETTTPSVSVRLNRRKVANESVSVVSSVETSAVPWCNGGYYLPERPDFTHDPALHQGLYYVQDASSMIISHVVSALAKTPVRYLDACAAPGGKTTAAIDALPDGSLVVANEFDYRRAEILKENVIKWGVTSVVVSRGDTARFKQLPEWFDIIAADVPCSGEGMMRKDEIARKQWSRALVDDCAKRQREIISNLWGALRPGGYLIYSTCTFNRVENEEMIRWILDNFGGEIVEIPELPDNCGIVVRNGGMMRFLPGRVCGEGLFMAVLRKAGDTGIEHESAVRKKKMKQRGMPSKDGRDRKADALLAASLKQCRNWVAEGYDINTCGDEIVAFPSVLKPELDELKSTLDIIHQGIELGSVKGRSVVPSQSLAMSLALAYDAFTKVEVGKDEALRYLRREAMEGYDAPRGHVLLMYKGHALGFVNNLGNRANNLYPAPWRILK